MRLNNRACRITQFTGAVAIVCHVLLACASAPTPNPTSVVATAPPPTSAPVIATASPTPTRVVATALPTPTPSPAAPTAPAPTPTVQDEIAIYLTVIRQVCGPDDTFGGNLRPSKLYIVRRTRYVPFGDLERPTLTTTVQQGISQGLADLHAKVIWVDTTDAVKLDKVTGQVVGGGVILELGAIQPETGDKVQVFGSIYVALLMGGGATYTVEREDGKWTITGDTGRWIS